ncbi:MAG: peptidase M14 [Bryobacterales bacterium]|nr:peptidase M14 [Bryobacterales bacterium]
MLALVLLLLLLIAPGAWGQIPDPAGHLGHTAGADYKLAGYDAIIGYFKKLDAASGRLKLEEYGRSAEGRPIYVAYISDEENLARLDRYKEISRRLALGRATAAEAAALAREGKAIVWIDSGLHATEVAPVQQAPELAWRMVTQEDEETRRIRRNVILLQVPVINPDGLEMVSRWYMGNVGTEYELAPLPWLYQKYAGHDNNRDWFMLNLVETRASTRMLFQEWFPQIVYNQHQTPAFPARIFIPPYAEPLNPLIPAAVMEGIHLIGAAMAERFALENKPGVLAYHGYDAWWNGGLRSVPAFHNMHGILTETALFQYATPAEYKPEDFPARFGNGLPTREPSIFYQRPWMGGRWAIRDAVEYMLTADFAILDLAASRAERFLLKSYQMAREAIVLGETAKPFAYVVPPDQWDRGAAYEMLERLAYAGVEIKRASATFPAGGKTHPAGTFVILAGQPFRAYLKDLLEPQRYPEIKTGGTGPTKQPYDVAGWTLPMSMGVRVEVVDEKFEAALDDVRDFSPPAAVEGDGAYLTLDRRDTRTYTALSDLLRDGAAVRAGAETFWIESAGATAILKRHGVKARRMPAAAPAEVPQWRTPRLALYEPPLPNMDAGWTQWVLDRFGIAHTKLGNTAVQAGGLRSQFDAIVLAAQSAASIVHGTRSGEYVSRPGQPRAVLLQRPEFTGGIGIAGVAALDEFVREGGTLIALDSATELPIQYFALPVRNVARGADGNFYCPGSLLRMTLDPAHPLGYGMPANLMGFSSGGQVFELNAEADLDRVVRFASSDLLASGWLSGAEVAHGRSALVVATHGKGRVILFGFRPQFRGQTFGTFKLLLNAIYSS